MGTWVLGISLTLVGAASAEILSADLRVDGMSCPFCAFGIEKKLLAVEGVTAVEVGLDEGRLGLQLEPNNRVTPAALGDAVDKAGFELGGLEVEVRGTLHVEGENTWLQAHRDLRLALFERDGEGGARPLPAARREGLPADGEGLVVVSGVVTGSDDAWKLVVEPAEAGQ